MSGLSLTTLDTQAPSLFLGMCMDFPIEYRQSPFCTL